MSAKLKIASAYLGLNEWLPHNAFAPVTAALLIIEVRDIEMGQAGIRGLQPPHETVLGFLLTCGRGKK